MLNEIKTRIEEKKKRSDPVVCNFQILFDVMRQDLEDGLCSDIWFVYKGKKHRMGVYGDFGNTYKNVKFYFDKPEYETLDEMTVLVELDGIRLKDFCNQVTVTECNGCYPRSTPILNDIFLQKDSINQ